MQIKRKSKKSLIILGSLLLLSSITSLGYKYYKNMSEKELEDIKIEEYYKEEINEENTEKLEFSKSENEFSKKESSYNYIGILSIPKINLKRGLVEKNSKYNTIRYNIMIHKSSDMPDVTNGNFILIAHSGNASYSYFKNLDKLNINDLINLDYKNKTYNYKIVNIYDIEKTGKASIKRDNNKSVMTLITCRHNTNKQIIIIAELIL